MARDIKRKDQKFSKEANDAYVKRIIEENKKKLREAGKPLKDDEKVIIVSSKMNQD